MRLQHFAKLTHRFGREDLLFGGGFALMFRLSLLLAVASSIAVCQSSRTAESRTSVKTFTYKRVENIDLHADVYRLPGSELRPVIFWLHGGALIFGSRGMLPADEREQFLLAGYVVVAIDYRLGPETKLAEILRDVEDAYRWVQEKGSGLFSADPKRVAVVGQSAGAYLALMAGILVHPSPTQSFHFMGTETSPVNGTAAQVAHQLFRECVEARG